VVGFSVLLFLTSYPSFLSQPLIFCLPPFLLSTILSLCRLSQGVPHLNLHHPLHSSIPSFLPIPPPSPSLLHLLLHSSTFSLTPPPSPSLLHLLPHSSTFSLTPPPSPSLLLPYPSLLHLLLHSSTFSFTPPPSPSLLHLLPHPVHCVCTLTLIFSLSMFPGI